MSDYALFDSGSADRGLFNRLLAELIAKSPFIKLTSSDSAVAASFLQQIHYWCLKEQGIIVDGVRWIWNSTKEWLKEQFPFLTSYKFRKIRAALAEAGLIISDRLKKKEWNQTLCYRVNYEFVNELMREFKSTKKAPKPLKSPICRNTTHQDVETENINVSTVRKSYTNKYNKELLQRKNIEAEAFQKTAVNKNTPAQEVTEDKAKELFVIGRNSKTTKNLESEPDNNNSTESTHIARVEQLVNKENKEKKEMPHLSEGRGQRAEGRRNDELRTNQKPMTDNKPTHLPEGDRFFGAPRPIERQRERAQYQSAVGMSGFKDVEDLRKCQKQLIAYFAQSLSPDKAAEKASWMIKDEKKGERSPYVQDYLDGDEIGTWCKKEWEIKPGKIAPMFMGYLRSRLRRDGDTREQCNVKAYWFLKNSTETEDAWAECKRLVDIEKPRLLKAIELGQNPLALKIPEWVIDAFRPEIPVEQVKETAEVLGAIASSYINQVEVNDQKYLEAAQQGILPKEDPNSPLYKLKQSLGLPCRDKVSSTEEQIDLFLSDGRTMVEGVKLAEKHNIPLIYNTLGVAVAVDYKKIEFLESQERRAAADKLMDKVVSDKHALDLAELLPETPKATIAKLQSKTAEITALLSNPITREVGLRQAKSHNLPLVYSDEGIAIAVDLQQLKDDANYELNREEPVELKGPAHQIYQAPQIEKGSLSAWEAAKARSKFFKRK